MQPSNLVPEYSQVRVQGGTIREGITQQVPAEDTSGCEEEEEGEDDADLALALVSRQTSLNPNSIRTKVDDLLQTKVTRTASLGIDDLKRAKFQGTDQRLDQRSNESSVVFTP